VNDIFERMEMKLVRFVVKDHWLMNVYT